MPRKYSPAKAGERIAFLRARIAGDTAEIADLSPKVETPETPPPTPAPVAPDPLARRAALVDELAAIDAAIEGERATLRQRLAALDLVLHRPLQLPGEPKPRHASPLDPGKVWTQQPEGHYAPQVAEFVPHNKAIATPVISISPAAGDLQTSETPGWNDPGPMPGFLRRDKAVTET